MELTSLTLSEASDLIARGSLSPVALTQAHLDRIARLNPSLNCFITLTADAALEQARIAEIEIRQGHTRGALHGIPLALKDLYETQGVRTTAGSSFLANSVPASDGAVVAKLNASGAVMLGKLSMHEWALGVTNNNPHFGPCHNPWGLEHVPGGSSGGSGAALAAELCLGSLGSDTGGSIRIPASLCGIVGLKPTTGRVSLRGVVPLSWNLDHAGPMARRVRDVAMLLQAIAGYDPQDPYSANVETGDYSGESELHAAKALEAGVRGWRVALATGDTFDDADPEVLSAVREAAKVFERLGAVVEEVTPPLGREAWQANGLMTVSDAAAFHRERLASQPDGFGADVLARLRIGAGASATDYALARRTQTLARDLYGQLLSRYDILLTPTTPTAAPLREGRDAVEAARLLTRFTSPSNLIGVPALSLPCGFTRPSTGSGRGPSTGSEHGLPIGLQIIARPWAEAQVLRAGYAYEQATEWHLRRPALPSPPTPLPYLGEGSAPISAR